MRIVTLPGVFRPISDSHLLAGCLRAELASGASVADVCTGSGMLAVAAAVHGAGQVTAVDVSRRAVLSARINARLNGVAVRAIRGDLLDAVPGERFDLIVSNPPYVPAADGKPPRGRARAWDAGPDGRAFLDRICDATPDHLEPGGAVLLVHSSVCGEDATLERLRGGGLDAEVVARRRGPLGPLMSERAPQLEERGLLAPGVREEELLVVRGRTG
jgi:release factor glutamine methyltransferase